jgi:3-methylfumaryl-CoA hydratase
VGDLVESATEVESVSVKEGRSGPLAFVDVARRFFARGRPGDLFVRELRTYVFRYGTSAPATTSSARARSVAPEVLAPHLQSTFTPDELALFRFSALTFNSHRIHYDLRWCVKVERFPGIVVHGPFTATMLCDLALNTYRTRVAAVRDGFPPIKSFSCRATAPLFANQSAQLAARVVQGASGATEVVMRATRLAADDEELDDEDADDGGTDGDKSQGAAEQADDLIMTAVATF